MLRETAAESLGWIGPGVKDAVPALLDVLTDDADGRVRTGAAFGLGRIKQDADAIVSALRKALKDKDAGVRHAAAHALGEVGPGRGRPFPHCWRR